MGVLKLILIFFGLAQKSAAVQEAEKALVRKGIGLIDHLFAWIETKEQGGHPIVLAATAKLQDLLDEHGEEDLIAFLRSRGIFVFVTPRILTAPPAEPKP